MRTGYFIALSHFLPPVTVRPAALESLPLLCGHNQPLVMSFLPAGEHGFSQGK